MRGQVDLLDRLLVEGQQKELIWEFDTHVMATAITKSIESALAEWVLHIETDLFFYAGKLVTLCVRGTEKRRDD
ncbi:hypothetical protein [Roseinatronobacter alkalisoli]|uniref:Uncharacterized protein n=1 Tax=Roseinatronobacter alkalisoli TaxID=3028235 RepID=A0ABT5T6U8_9RHOB|nr:hypothetical protein [Roseinatronobacter sp. HJB301]MDD7970841.1 hypothetical protein [Roseinatronobacter sp. HJB301]